jgi:hypothetical protein
MRPYIASAALLVALAGITLAAGDAASQLKARADAARGGEQAKLCLEYARQELESANSLYDGGQFDQAKVEIEEVVEYARKGEDAATGSGKQLKETEIRLRKLAQRMHDIGNSLDFEDRRPMKKAIDQIEQLRADLLVKMWGPQAEPKGRS